MLKRVIFLLWISLVLLSCADNNPSSGIESFASFPSYESETAQIDSLLLLSAKARKSALDESLSYAHEALKIAVEIDHEAKKVKCYDFLGRTHFRKGEMILCINYFEKGLTGAHRLQDQQLIGHLSQSLGISLAQVGKYGQALGHFIQALEIWQREEKFKNQASLLLNFGSLHKKLGNYDKAIEMFNQSISIARTNSMDRLEAVLLNNLGNAYKSKKHYDTAFEYLSEALELQRTKPPLQRLSTLESMSELFRLQKDYVRAQAYTDSVKQIAEAHNNTRWLFKASVKQGDIYFDQKQYAQALTFYLNSLPYSETLKDADQNLVLYEKIAQSYVKQSNFKAAYSFQEKHNQLKDSIFNEQTERQLAELNTKYDLASTEQQLVELKKDHTLYNYQLVFLLILLCMATLLIIIGYSRMRIKQKGALLLQEKSQEIKTKNELLELQSQEMQLQNTQLKQSNTDLEQFAYAASHDLREPLRTIRSYMQLLEKRYKPQLDSNAIEFIQYAVDGATRMDSLLKDLMLYAQIGSHHAPKARVDLNQVLERVEQNLSKQIYENDAKILYGEMPQVVGNEAELYQLFQNLVSNAIKFRTEDHPIITISSEQQEEAYIFKIQDNGIGIAKEYQEKIFQLFQRLHSKHQYQGTGIGLALCNRIVKKHGGNIWLDSTPGQGSTFYIKLPIHKHSHLGLLNGDVSSPTNGKANGKADFPF